jgi:hypothetical protein
MGVWVHMQSSVANSLSLGGVAQGSCAGCERPPTHPGGAGRVVCSPISLVILMRQRGDSYGTVLGILLMGFGLAITAPTSRRYGT